MESLGWGKEMPCPLISSQDLSMEFVKYIHKTFKRLFCHMRGKYTTIINNNICDDNFLLLDNKIKLLGMSFQH